MEVLGALGLPFAPAGSTCKAETGLGGSGPSCGKVAVYLVDNLPVCPDCCGLEWERWQGRIRPNHPLTGPKVPAPPGALRAPLDKRVRQRLSSLIEEAHFRLLLFSDPTARRVYADGMTLRGSDVLTSEEQQLLFEAARILRRAATKLSEE